MPFSFLAVAVAKWFLHLCAGKFPILYLPVDFEAVNHGAKRKRFLRIGKPPFYQHPPSSLVCMGHHGYGGTVNEHSGSGMYTVQYF